MSDILFYDFEVFSHDWLVVIIDPVEKKENIIVNNRDELAGFYYEHKTDIWIGWNSRHYDQYILKGILEGLNPKKINDWIIEKGKSGWRYSAALRNWNLNNYDLKNNIDRGLKVYEGFMGHDIRESSVSFNINRPLTDAEIAETAKYCRHDVEETIEIFLRRKSDFIAQWGLLKMYDLPLADISKTKVQMTAQILEAKQRYYDDEFDIDLPDTLRLNKYRCVADWYMNQENRKYQIDPRNPKSGKLQLITTVAGVPHTFGWGGVHGARDKYVGEGWFVNMDVASLYPSLMIEYDLHSRSCNPVKYREIRDKRLRFKANGNAQEKSLKLALNGTYGAMKDKTNPLYDPRQSNRVCVYGQLLLLDLIEKLEPHCDIIQSNTDGVLVRLREYKDFDTIDDIAHEWEQRTRLTLEFDEFSRIYQGDVNNYVMVAEDGTYKSKGAYVKELNDLDYDLAIINRALVAYLVNGIPVEQTINSCDDLRDFQMIASASAKYKELALNGELLNGRTARVFASTDWFGGGLLEKVDMTGKRSKYPNAPSCCFMNNGDVRGKTVPDNLDREWYINTANKRLRAKFAL